MPTAKTLDLDGPCPWVGCRLNLYAEVDDLTGALKLNFPDKEVWELEETCAIRVVKKRGALSLEEVGKLINLTQERVSTIEEGGLAKMKRWAKGARRGMSKRMKPWWSPAIDIPMRTRRRQRPKSVDVITAGPSSFVTLALALEQPRRTEGKHARKVYALTGAGPPPGRLRRGDEAIAARAPGRPRRRADQSADGCLVP